MEIGEVVKEAETFRKLSADFYAVNLVAKLLRVIEELRDENREEFRRDH